MEDGKPKTVRELIEQLQKCNPDAVVSTEGCDCTGPWSGGVKEYTLVRRGKTVPVVCICRDDDRGVLS